MNNLKDLTLLYVEDEIETLNLYLRYFKSIFQTIYTAKDGNEALKHYEDFNPDVLILDINLPFISGLEIAEKIRKKDKKTKIILLTAMSDKDTFLQAVELNLTTFLEKPVSRERLKEALLKLSINSKIILCKEDNKTYIYDAYQNELLYDNETINLTKNEKKLMGLFVDNLNRKISYQEIYECIWFENDKDFSLAAIKTLLNGLRSKLPKDIIQNSYGIGYFITPY